DRRDADVPPQAGDRPHPQGGGLHPGLPRPEGRELRYPGRRAQVRAQPRARDHRAQKNLEARSPGLRGQGSPAARARRDGDGELVVSRPTERGEDRALHGLTRTLVANMVEGVTKGFEKRLEIQGVGYRAALRGTSLELNVGFSHSVVVEPRAGITFEVPAPTQVVVKGVDKQQVGQTAAEVRSVRPPEPYKGKGIRYEG